MANNRMTQSQLSRNLAETSGVNSKVAKQFLETLAEVAVAKPRRMAYLWYPASDAWSVWIAKPGRGATRPLAKHQDPGQEGREVPRG